MLHRIKHKSDMRKDRKKWSKNKNNETQGNDRRNNEKRGERVVTEKFIEDRKRIKTQ